MARQRPGWAWAMVAVVVGARWAAGVCVAVGGQSNVYNLEGDAVLTLLLPLHHGQQCHLLGLSEVHILEATKLAVNTVNSLGFLPNITLGLRAMDTCGDPNYSVKMALASWASDALSCPSPVLSLGFLGPEDMASASAVARATISLGTPVLAYGPRPATAPEVLDLLTPAPQRTVQAAVQVLNGVGVDAISIVHTADLEGQTLAQHFIEAAEYVYICVEMVMEDGDTVGMSQVLREGPGTVVVLGTRHRVQALAKVLGGTGGPADLLLLVDTGGPIPQVELAGLEAPALILQRAAQTLPELISFLGRDLESYDEPRVQYLVAVSECKSCAESDFGYDPIAPAAIAAVLAYAKTLLEAQKVHCAGQEGLCHDMRSLKTSVWSDFVASTSIEAMAKEAFPSLLEANLTPGSEDIPRYKVKLLIGDNITQVGQADESSAVLGELLVPQPRCGSQCPCLLPPLPPDVPPPPEISLPPAEISPPPEISLPPEVPLPTKVPSTTISDTSSGFDIMSGSEWWTFEWPVGFQHADNMSKGEMATYITAFAFIIIIFICASLVCAFRLNSPPRRH